MVVDDRDWKIIELLKQNARISNTEIARALNISEGTVRKRISQLLSSGAIRHFTLDLGKDAVVALVLIKVRTEESRHVLEELRKRFEEIYETSGPYDLSVRIVSPDLQAVNSAADEIRSIKGVKNTDTLVRLG